MCCGASKRVGMLPQIPFLLGKDDGKAAQYVVINDAALIPNVRVGAQRYVKGSGVQQAFDDGKITTIQEAQRAVTAKRNIKYLVTLPSGRALRFGVKRTAEQYAQQSGGTLSEA